MRNIILSILFLLSLNLLAKPNTKQPKETIKIEPDTICTDTISADTVVISQDPVLSFDSETYHFGTLDTLRQDLEYDFNFCNEGLDTLKIHRIITAPGVTILERKLISQYGYDEGGTIRFVIDSKEIKGKFKKSIYIYSNTATKRLTLSGTVLRPRY